MNKTSIVKCVKDTLNNCLAELDSNRWLCCNKLTDFTRNRKISFTDTLKFMLQLESKSLPNEILDFFDHKSETPTVSALIQQRNKINSVTYVRLFDNFTRACLKNVAASNSTFRGYHLIAVDGTDMNIRRNPSDDETFITDEGKGHNAIHLNAMYDLLQHVYVDATIQGKKKVHERAAFNTMVDRYSAPTPAIFIADRGYESYNTMAHVIEKEQKFLIRVKDATSNGILCAYAFEPGPFDVDITTTITKRRTKETTEVNADKYTILLPGTDFDFVCQTKDTYDISFRIVRFKVGCDKYVTVATNFSRDEFSADDIEKLYRLRWCEETSFRDLKYNLGTVNFHSKDTKYIKQELYAKLTAYNYCAFIAYRVRLKKSERRKHHYKINFATAVNICMAYFRKGGDDNDLLLLLARQLSPIRPYRRYPLNIRSKRNKGFSYRTA